MSIRIDKERGTQLAKLLYYSFTTTGIHGRTDMPEDILPEGILRGSLDHVLFITLTVSIDYQRDAPTLWNNSRTTFNDPTTRYLFNPKAIHETPIAKIVQDMKRHGLSKKTINDAKIWQTVGASFFRSWNGNPLHFLEACNWDSSQILKRLRDGKHIYHGQWGIDYPFLRGSKIGPLWLRMLRDNVGVSQLKCLDKVPIPVDIHIARATLATGIVKGEFDGRLDELFGHIREAWFESVKGLRVQARDMIALDVDEPLWHLSKFGCTNRDKTTGTCPHYSACEAKAFCTKGVVKIDGSHVVLET